MREVLNFENPSNREQEKQADFYLEKIKEKWVNPKEQDEKFFVDRLEEEEKMLAKFSEENKMRRIFEICQQLMVNIKDHPEKIHN